MEMSRDDEVWQMPGVPVPHLGALGQHLSALPCVQAGHHAAKMKGTMEMFDLFQNQARGIPGKLPGAAQGSLVSAGAVSLRSAVMQLCNSRNGKSKMISSMYGGHWSSR